ncbi:MAG: hypothetical protein M5U29_04235 [Anaerolineae bacterium]|nr:hypothetical protein [Anaerolineae bacterium]
MSKSERNPNGTFAEGNPGGPGRPSRATEREYMSIVMTACTLDDWCAIVERAVQDARNGDGAARAWLASYLVGKPSASHTAPRPTRVLAAELAEVDEVADEAAKMRHMSELDAMLNSLGRR